MHAVFIPYGKKEKVDILLRDISAQKLPLKVYKKGEPDKFIFIECQLRCLPFGAYEFVFPKEFMNEVLTSLKFQGPIPYGLKEDIKIFKMKINPLKYLKKYLRLEDPIDFKPEKKMLWIDDDVSIIPLGIRYDGEITETKGEMKDWTHEAI